MASCPWSTASDGGSREAVPPSGGPDKPVVFLMGPTASGKTELAVELVEQFPSDIVSVDSAMVYRGMDVGTAKPDAALLARAPHRLIDIRDPAEAYSAAEFVADAQREIAAIHAAGRVPLLVGGTMLYFRALEHGLSPLPAAESAVRAQLSARAEQAGWPALHAELAQADPAIAARLHPNDGQRIQRALEILTISGEPPSALQQRDTAPARDWTPLKLAIAPGDREQLHARIRKRFDAMLAAGFLAEVEKLRSRPDLHLELPAMRAVGYRQLWQYLDGSQSYETAVERGVIASRQLAKRQLTWLRRDNEIAWLNGSSPQVSDDACRRLQQALARA